MPPISVNTAGPLPSEPELRSAVTRLNQQLQDLSLMREAVFSQLRHVRKELAVCKDVFDRLSYEGQEKTLTAELETVDVRMGRLCAERYRATRLADQLRWEQRQAELQRAQGLQGYRPVEFAELRPYGRAADTLMSTLGTGSAVIVASSS